MPKKSSSKPSKIGQPNPVVANWEMPKEPVLRNSAVAKEKPSSTPKTFGQEIEEIFSKKRKKPEQEKTRKVAEGVAGKPSKSDKKTCKDDASVSRKKKSKSGGSNVDVFEHEQLARPKRKTGDGLVIYTEDELGIGRVDAGGTRLCPFDCDCCF